MTDKEKNHNFDIPLITVITLSYNSEFLFESIKSVLNQTYPKIEYVIVDDGSKYFEVDEVSAFINQHKQKNLLDYKVIVNPKNMGTVKASNIAIVHSTGEFLFNLAADDVFYDIRVLEGWVREFIKRESLVMTAQSAVYDSTLTYFQKVLPEKKEVLVLKSENANQIFEQLCYANFIYGCCTARSRKVFDSFGLYDEKYKLIEDYPFALNISRHGVSIDYWNMPVIRYRQGGISSPGNFNKVYEDDSDLIFKNEILPYTKHKFKVTANYKIWKMNRKENIRFYKYYSYWKNTNKVWMLPFLGFRYPIPTLRALKRYFVSRKDDCVKNP
ncbi:glycosyltransferase [Enterocloster citroniae]|uniref:Glycosyltransferase involved in cell wall biosynthesis n=2 Tax=Enterocloster citroniae TaxID=358743 RepID=A0ABV2FXF2_9FIRM|nr:glycosyltransferase [Enterocloster citroniae]KMW24253.1 hypothetical protein HMPREF9470_00115 [[Clostridium] citroniae WAL-19142]